MLDDIEREAGAWSRLVESMLDLSRVESRRAPPAANADAGGRAACGGGDEQPRCARGEGVEVDVPEELPPVTVDETMIRQVLVNLLENATATRRTRSVLIDAASAGPLRCGSSITGPASRTPSGGACSSRTPAPARHALRRRAGLGLAISRGFVRPTAGRSGSITTPGGGATFVDRPPRRHPHDPRQRRSWSSTTSRRCCARSASRWSRRATRCSGDER